MARLTHEQESVANHRCGHALVSAVAGSGKSTTLVERCHRLLIAGVPASQILVVQYNKSAQLDFEQKLLKRLGDFECPSVLTFHALCWRIYRQLASRGILDQVRLGSDRDEINGARRALKASASKGETLTKEQLAEFIGFMTLVKAGLDDVATVFDQTTISRMYRSQFIAAFSAYEMDRKQDRRVHFDDQIYDVAMLFASRPELWSYYRDSKSHLMIDEFQDINSAQMSIIEGLTGPNTSVMAVGDADQAIYSWRGSKVQFITSIFAERFQPCTRYPMSQTFRFGHRLALMANNIITVNEERDDKITVSAVGSTDTRIERLQPDHMGCNPKVIAYLQQRKNDRTLKDAAVLVRYYSMAVGLEIELLSAGIPYHVHGRDGLVYEPEIGCLVAALAMAANYWPFETPHVGMFMSSILQAPTLFVQSEGISDIVREVMIAFCDEGQSGIGAAIKKGAGALGLQPQVLDGIRDRAEFIELLTSGAMSDLRPTEIIRTYIDHTDLLASLAKQAPTPELGAEKVRNVEAMMQAAQGQETIRELLDLLGPMAAVKKDEPPKYDHLTIRSGHASKGGEWDQVILPGWNATSIREPTPELVEEERRLAYVSVTRAKKHLVVIHVEDPELQALIDDPAEPIQVERGRRLASSYIYDADLGLVESVADAIAHRDVDVDVIVSRAPANAVRYIEALGLSEQLRVIITPEIAHLAARRKLTASTKLAVGDLIWSQAKGDCEVIRQLGTHVYHLRHVADGSSSYESLHDPTGWFTT